MCLLGCDEEGCCACIKYRDTSCRSGRSVPEGVTAKARKHARAYAYTPTCARIRTPTCARTQKGIRPHARTHTKAQAHAHAHARAHAHAHALTRSHSLTPTHSLPPCTYSSRPCACISAQHVTFSPTQARPSLTFLHTGEYGELLVGGAGGPLISRESPSNLRPDNSGDVVTLLERVLQKPLLPAAAREYVLTALVKLSTRFPEQNARIQVRMCL